MASQSVALKHWKRAVQRWPVDKVRPENVSFQRIMQQRLNRLTSPPSPAEAAASVTSNQALVSPQTTAIWDEAKEMQQVNSLYTLLEDRFSKSYPLPASLRRPASGPSYYDDLVKEMEDAPSRSWLGNVVNRIKGSFRLT